MNITKKYLWKVISEELASIDPFNKIHEDKSVSWRGTKLPKPYPTGYKHFNSIVHTAITRVKNLGGWEAISNWTVHAGKKPMEVVFTGRFDASGQQLPAGKEIVAKGREFDKKFPGARKAGLAGPGATGAAYMLIGTVRAVGQAAGPGHERHISKYTISSFLRFVDAETGRMVAANESDIEGPAGEASSYKFGEAVEALLRRTFAKAFVDLKKILKGGQRSKITEKYLRRLATEETMRIIYEQFDEVENLIQNVEQPLDQTDDPETAAIKKRLEASPSASIYQQQKTLARDILAKGMDFEGMPDSGIFHGATVEEMDSNWRIKAGMVNWIVAAQSRLGMKGEATA